MELSVKDIDTIMDVLYQREIESIDDFDFKDSDYMKELIAKMEYLKLKVDPPKNIKIF